MAPAKLLTDQLIRPIGAASAAEFPNLLFIAEQRDQGGTGRIRLFDLSAGQLLPDPVAEFSSLARGNEQGLLGLAIHPGFKENGYLFTNSTRDQEHTAITVIERCEIDRTSWKEKGSSRRSIFQVAQPYPNHNGGWLAFGPKDGFLYAGLGDGGSANDPEDRSQNPRELLGKLLRLDIDRTAFSPDDATRYYAIPDGNPFRNQPDTLAEIWALGLRNPWRCSFDRLTGDLWIGDVGQDRYEEVNFQPSSSPGGENYGWRLREGLHPTGLSSMGSGPFVDPIHEYTHDVGSSVIGGYVYRGTRLPEFVGAYIFGDHFGRVWALPPDEEGARTDPARIEEITNQVFPNGMMDGISSFAEDANGELYIITLDPGAIYRLEP